MTRAHTRLAAAVLAAAGFAVLPATPAHATVHEIVGQWCSGQDPLGPPGISGGSHADNFARPLAASGFFGPVVPHDDGFLLTFNWDNPNSKVVGSGVFIQVGEIEGQPSYIELPEPNPEFAAFMHCPKLAA